jgi:hypothetical protein
MRARLAEAAEGPERALISWKEALTVLEPLLQRPSLLPLWQQRAALVRAAIARLEAARPAKPRKPRRKR